MNERRRSGRFEPVMEIPARIGRREGVVLNVSHRGVRVRHLGSLKVAELTDVAFPCAGGQFFSRARVLSCRAVPIKDHNGAMMFESRLAFASPPADAVALLDKFLGR
jgi:hypothetical protein